MRVDAAVEQVIEQIKDAIIRRVYGPGERIVEFKLAKELGLGRSKIRQALWQLEQEGFIDIVPNVGAVVRELSQRDVVQIYDLMGALEGLSMRVATPNLNGRDIERLEAVVRDMEQPGNDRSDMVRLNNEFHSMLAEMGQNERLAAFYRQLAEQTHRLILEGLYNQVHTRASTREHRQIVEAVRNRKASTVATLIRRHYLASKDRLIKYLNRSL